MSIKSNYSGKSDPFFQPEKENEKENEQKKAVVFENERTNTPADAQEYANDIAVGAESVTGNNSISEQKFSGEGPVVVEEQNDEKEEEKAEDVPAPAECDNGQLSALSDRISETKNAIDELKESYGKIIGELSAEVHSVRQECSKYYSETLPAIRKEKEKYEKIASGTFHDSILKEIIRLYKNFAYMETKDYGIEGQEVFKNEVSILLGQILEILAVNGIEMVCSKPGDEFKSFSMKISGATVTDDIELKDKISECVSVGFIAVGNPESGTADRVMEKEWVKVYKYQAPITNEAKSN